MKFGDDIVECACRGKNDRQQIHNNIGARVNLKINLHHFIIIIAVYLGIELCGGPGDDYQMYLSVHQPMGAPKRLNILGARVLSGRAH